MVRERETIWALDESNRSELSHPAQDLVLITMLLDLSSVWILHPQAVIVQPSEHFFNDQSVRTCMDAFFLVFCFYQKTTTSNSRVVVLLLLLCCALRLIAAGRGLPETIPVRYERCHVAHSKASRPSKCLRAERARSWRRPNC